MRARRYLFTFVLAFAGAVEPLGAETFVATQFGPARVEAFADDANGVAAPLRTLSGPATGLNGPGGVALDEAHSELFVVNISGASVTVYQRNASGDSAPLRTLAGPLTGLGQPVAIAVDPLHGEIFVSNFNDASVRVFSRTANGNVAPSRVIAGPATGLQYVGGVFLDLIYDEVYVANGRNGQPHTPAIRVFPRTANGDVAPSRSLVGATALPGPAFDMFVDPYRDELVVGHSQALSTFQRTASGDATPLRRITGFATGLASPFGITVTETEILAITTGGTLAFPRLATGNLAPVRTISGAFPFMLTSSVAAAGGSGRGGGENNLLLQGSRFRLEGIWRTSTQLSGTAQPVPLTADTGYLWFFTPANVEVVGKVLNGCPVNANFWVFLAGLTNVETVITVTDTQSGARSTYVNPQGTPFQPVQNTTAFATCP